MRKLVFLVLTAFLVAASSARAHYNMLLPSTASGKKGEEATITYQWGHPFEHQLFDAPLPERFEVRDPDGATRNLTKALKRVALPSTEGKTVIGYRYTFTPDQRGDYVATLTTPPIWMAEEGEFLQDSVKVVFHVQAQKSWFALRRQPLEWQPLTRPYGLEPGMVFQARLMAWPPPPKVIVFPEKPPVIQTVADTMVEVERYNVTPPKKLPSDEQMTRVCRTDVNGVATCTLTDPGWWAITALRDGGKREHDGKDAPLTQRSTLWVFVDEKAK